MTTPIDTTRLRADLEAVRDAGVKSTYAHHVVKRLVDAGHSDLTSARKDAREAAEALRGAQKRLYRDAPPDGIILALLDEVERLRAMVAPPATETSDSRGWCWHVPMRCPVGPFATREECITDARAEAGMDDVTIGRCEPAAPGFDMVSLIENAGEQLSYEGWIDIEVKSRDGAEQALSEWCERYLYCEGEPWAVVDEELVDIATEPEEGGTR